MSPFFSASSILILSEYTVMSKRQEAKDPRDAKIAQLEQQVSMLQVGITETNRLLQQMVAQIGTITTSTSHLRTTPWREAFGIRYDAIVKTLSKDIPYEAVSSIVYKGGERIPYVTGYYVYSAMNAIFGPDAWSYTVNVTRTGSALYNATVTINVEGVSRTNGSASKPAKGNAPEQLAMKAAITNAFKRAAANFGNVLGLCLYNQAYVREFSKAKASRQIPIDEDKVIKELYALSHPTQDIQTTGVQIEKHDNLTLGVSKEGVDEVSITDLKQPSNINQQIKSTSGLIPVDFQADKTPGDYFIPKEGSLTYTEQQSKDSLKRDQPVQVDDIDELINMMDF